MQQNSLSVAQLYSILHNSHINELLFQVFIDGTAEIIQPNVSAENGFVHVIDKVSHK